MIIDKYVSRKILEFLRDEKALGRYHAIPHEAILNRIRIFEPEINDREFRRIYSELPICACDCGLYIPIEPADLVAFRDYMKGKAIPLFDRVKKVWAAYPELNPDESAQLELKF